MKLASPTPCRACRKPVAICKLRDDKWMSFELPLVAAGDDVIDAYLPMKMAGKIVYIPIADVAPRHLAGVRWYVQRHRCAQYLRAKAAEKQARLARRESVDSFADAFDDLPSGWGQNP